MSLAVINRMYGNVRAQYQNIGKRVSRILGVPRSELHRELSDIGLMIQYRGSPASEYVVLSGHPLDPETHEKRENEIKSVKEVAARVAERYGMKPVVDGPGLVVGGALAMYVELK